MFMFKLHNDNNLVFQVFGCVCLMGIRAVICLSLFIHLFIYLGSIFLGFLPLCFYCHISFKGALDKSNIYLFISSSIKDCKSN